MSTRYYLQRFKNTIADTCKNNVNFLLDFVISRAILVTRLLLLIFLRFVYQKFLSHNAVVFFFYQWWKSGHKSLRLSGLILGKLVSLKPTICQCL